MSDILKQTTLCYLIKNDDILMMHRNKKTNDPNHGKWIGIGGHIEKDEHLYQAMKREVLEETGLDVKTYHYHGVIFFESNQYEHEVMHLFSSSDFSGNVIENNEGTLSWVHMKDLLTLNLWEGDFLFLKLMLDGSPFFHLRLVYDKDTLVHHDVTFMDQ